jgi:hypothetical protein
MFSLEGPEGLRFLSRGRLFDAQELQALKKAPPVMEAPAGRGR